MSEEKEVVDLKCFMPSNYENFGRLFGGAIEIRNLIETIILCTPIFFIYKVLFMENHLKVFFVLMILTFLPIALLCIFGVNGDSFFQFLSYVFKYCRSKKEFRYKKIERININKFSQNKVKLKK